MADYAQAIAEVFCQTSKEKEFLATLTTKKK